MRHLLKVARSTLGVQIERDVGRSGQIIPPTLIQTGFPQVITISPRDKRGNGKVILDGESDDNGNHNHNNDEDPDGDASRPQDGGTATLPVTASNATTTPLPATASQDSTSSPSTVPIGVLIGSVLGTVALMGAVLLICYLRVLRRKRVARLPQPTTTSAGNGVPPESARVLSRRAVFEPYIVFTAQAVRPVPERIARTDFIPSRRPWQHHNSIAKGGRRYPAAYTSRYTASTSTALWSDDIVSESTERENGRTGRRAVDVELGSTDTEEEDDRPLPPKYGDVYNIPRSPMFLSRR